MKKIIALALVATFLVSLTGCSSVIARGMTSVKEDIDYSGIYPGPRCSFDFFFRPDLLDKDIKTNLRPAARAPYGVIAMIDLPISFACDTLMLPIDLLLWATNPK